MHRLMVVSALFSLVTFTVVFAGCQTTPAQQIDRNDILQALNGGELAVNIALSFAESRGTDVTQAREAAMLAFDTARDVVRVDFGDLSPGALRTAMDGIKAVVADVLRICEAAGVPETRIDLLEVSIEGVYAVVESVIDAMEARG